MRLSAVFVCCALGLAVAGCDDDSPTAPSNPPVVFIATLSAANEVPPISQVGPPRDTEQNASGRATITFNLTRDAANTVTGATADFQVSLTGFPAGSTATVAHIHLGPAGQNGGIEVNTGLGGAIPAVAMPAGTGSFAASNITVDAADTNAILANPAGYYFNVHTTLNPGGAVRGQLVRQ